MSSGKASISPFVGVLICINTMIGAGLFINPRLLVLNAGKWGFAGYAISALLILPLILSISTLAKLHPVSGGLYVFSKEYIGRWAGFLSGWSYFVGKAVAAGLLMHKFVQFFQSQFICLNQVSTLGLDYIILFFLIIIHILGVGIGGKIQYLFICLKTIPIIFVFVLGFTSFDSSFYQLDTTSFYNAFMIVPICVFASTGFEIICSVGHMIKDATKNIKKVILIAFSVVISVNIIFQFLAFGALGNLLVNANIPILPLAQKAIPAYEFSGRFFNGMVYAAILGACFSIITANSWNLFALAENNHVPFKKFFTRILANHVPWVALVFEGIIVAVSLAVTQGDQAPLQTLAVFAQLVAMLLSAWAAYFAAKQVKGFGLTRWVPLLGIFSALYILSISMFNIVKYGVSGSFLLIFSVGILAAISKKSIRD